MACHAQLKATVVAHNRTIQQAALFLLAVKAPSRLAVLLLGGDAKSSLPVVMDYIFLAAVVELQYSRHS